MGNPFDGMGAALIDGLSGVAESVVYTPVGGTGTTITAIVVRGDEPGFRSNRRDELYRSSNANVMRSIYMYVSSSDISDVNVQGDVVELKRSVGDTGTIKLRVRDILEQCVDGYMLSLGP